MENKHIEVLVRGIIQNKEGKILVCQKKGKNYYFFPGGHVEYGESTKDALARELKEELDLDVEETSFMGGFEHMFVEYGKEHHEINLFYKVEVKEFKIESKENHLDFFLFTKEELKKETVFPEISKEWFENKKIFWKGQIEK